MKFLSALTTRPLRTNKFFLCAFNALISRDNLTVSRKKIECVCLKLQSIFLSLPFCPEEAVETHFPKPSYCSLDEKWPPSYTPLCIVSSIWSQLMALFRKVQKVAGRLRRWSQAGRCKSMETKFGSLRSCPIYSYFLCFMLMVPDVISQHLVSAALAGTFCHASLAW